jgi:hypothetical protein
MHLSCGNCKSIQSFSGDPLKCDVCGWVSGTVSDNQDGSGNIIWKILAGVGIAFFSLFVVLAAVNWLPDLSLSEQERLAKQYNVSAAKVVVVPEPHGCDFEDAPLGNKHCHYEKVVDVERACPSPNCQVTNVYESWKKVEE